MEDDSARIPDDANKLRISGPCLEALTAKLLLPPSFIFALSRHYLPNGRCTRKLEIEDLTAFDSWYLLPVRVQFESGSSQCSVPVNDTGPNQMDPFNKIHLSDVGMEIHRSCIGIFCRTEPNSTRATFLAVDFMHGGRGPKVAVQPRERIEEVLNHRSKRNEILGSASFAHIIYLSSAAHWWTNSLQSINMQLISYETKLQTELENTQSTAETLLQNVNKGLHCIAAHLYRYRSELRSLERIIVDISTHYDFLNRCGNGEAGAGSENDGRRLGQILSEVEACHDFATELEKKTQNILALVS